MSRRFQDVLAATNPIPDDFAWLAWAIVTVGAVIYLAAVLPVCCIAYQNWRILCETPRCQRRMRREIAWTAALSVLVLAGLLLLAAMFPA